MKKHNMTMFKEKKNYHSVKPMLLCKGNFYQVYVRYRL